MSENSYFDGFSWAIPDAFANVLAACKFERGDTLYDTRCAYEGHWQTVLPDINYSIQVKSPKRGIATKATRKAPSSEDGDSSSEISLKTGQYKSVFENNWDGSVSLTLTDHKINQSREIETTQGCLYTLLWKGDLAWLDKSNPSPPIPTLAMQIRNDLSRAFSFVANTRPFAGTAFLMPYDRTNEILTSKLRNIDLSLKDFHSQVSFISPNKAGLIASSGAGFAPTVEIACVYIEVSDLHTVEEALKSVLYVPTVNRKTEKSKFKIESHGWLGNV